MNFSPLSIELMQLLCCSAAAPVFAYWVKMLKCWMQGRVSPGLFQPYRDILKLFSKDVVLAENASWIFRFTPYLVFGATPFLQEGLSRSRRLILSLSPPRRMLLRLLCHFCHCPFFSGIGRNRTSAIAFGGMRPKP